MFKEFFEKFPSYEITKKASNEVLAAYQNKLPVELIQFWSEFGFGIFMNGYLKIVNPAEYQETLNDGYDNPNQVEIVFAITALGDFLLWTGDAIRAVYFRKGTDKIIESGDYFTWFFDMDLTDEGFIRHNLDDRNFQLAIQKLGALNYDECFGYEPLLVAGGSENIDCLKKVQIKIHINMISQFSGKI